jgi:MFS family permease
VLVVNMAYAWMVAGVWSTLIPLFGREQVGLSEVGVGLGLAVASAAEFAVLFHAGAAADRYGRKFVLVPSLALLAASVATLGLLDTVPLFVLGLGILGVASGYAGVPPAAMLSDVAPPDSSATAIGVYRFVADLGFMLGPLVAGVAASSIGFEAAFVASALPSVVALGLLLSISETMRSARRAPEPGTAV